MFTVLSPTAFQAGGVTGTPGASVPGRGVGRFVGGSLLREQSGNISTVRSPGRLGEDQLRVPAPVHLEDYKSWFPKPLSMRVAL